MLGGAAAQDALQQQQVKTISPAAQRGLKAAPAAAAPAAGSSPGWGVSPVRLAEVPEQFWRTIAPDVHHEISEFLFDKVCVCVTSGVCMG